jgi:hypothetical protein
MQSGTGIQELMAAEQRASQIVAEARVGESMIVDDGELYDGQLPFSPSFVRHIVVVLCARGFVRLIAKSAT